MSPQFWRTLGYDPAEKSHHASEWQDIIHPADRATATENFQRHCADPEYPYDQEVRFTHRDGSTVWIRCRGIAIRNEHGEPTRMLGAHTNITELKAAQRRAEMREQELAKALADAERARDRLSLVIEAQAEGIWDWPDITQEAQWWSPQFFRLLGYRPGEIPSRLAQFWSLVHPDDQAVTTAAVDRTIGGQGPYDVTFRMRTKSGEYLWMRARGRVFDMPGGVRRFAGSVANVHDRVLAELDRDPKLSAIPVVILSSSGEKDDIERAYARHANSYLLKPAGGPSAFENLVRAVEAYWTEWNVRPNERERTELKSGAPVTACGAGGGATSR